MRSKKFKRILSVFLWLSVITGIGISLGFITKKQDSSRCRDLIINIDYRDAEHFISEKDITTGLDNTFGSLVGQPMSKVNVEGIMKVIKNNQYVEDAKAFSTINGIIKVDVVQRKPFLRIFDTLNRSCYLDDKGRLMALHPEHITRLLIVSGNIQADLSEESISIRNFRCRADGSAAEAELNKVFLLTKEINKSSFLTAQIEQVYITSQNKIELIPKVGHNLVIFGDTSDMAEKLKNLTAFYLQAIQKTGWERYDTINLEYKNQVVCSKH
jgi:cell division protein FtsQ